MMSGRRGWSSAIGIFLIHFRTLNLRVQDFQENELPSEKLARLKDRPFYIRIERTKADVRPGDYSAERRKQFGEFFRRLDPVRDLRNHLAHGLLRIGLARDQKT